LDTNSKFQIWFPPEILFKGTIACNPISQVVQAVTCKRSDRTVTVQFTFRQQKIDGGTVFGFEIVDVYNPSSTKPTSPYSMILLRDENDFVLSQYTAKTVTTQNS